MTAVPGERRRRERGSITPEEILDGAFAVAERDSLDNLSMPELARHLGVGVTSIYWYFRKKEDLIRAMCDEAFSAVQQMLPNPATAINWRDFLEEYYTKTREIYRGNDLLADLVLVRTGSYSLAQTHEVYRSIEKIVRVLVNWGFEPLDAWRINTAISNFTRGIILQERAQRLHKSPTLDSRQSKLILPESMPLIDELYSRGEISLAMAMDQDFDYGLAMLLEAAQQIHDSR